VMTLSNRPSRVTTKYHDVRIATPELLNFLFETRQTYVVINGTPALDAMKGSGYAGAVFPQSVP